MTTVTFHDLGIIEQITRVLDESNYITPTPIQFKALPLILDNQDVLGIAQTGTGKTAAFSLPLLQNLFQTQSNPKPRTVRALILAPTRELVIQIADSCKKYGKYLSLRQTSIYGGVHQNTQVKIMSKGVDLLIATPGRLLDLINQGHVDLGSTTHLILDEADRMFDLGFIVDIKKIIAKIPAKRQTILFSATMPKSINDLANTAMKNHKVIEISPEVVTVKNIDQSLHFIRKSDKSALLVKLLKDDAINKAIIFIKTKHNADRVAQVLKHNDILSDTIHGDKSHGLRQRALESFKNSKTNVLIATDIASRGIDFKDITHVINYDLPNEVENYVHRIGRTARAGTKGIAISFCDETERKILQNIEKIIKMRLKVVPTPGFDKLEALPPMEPKTDFFSRKKQFGGSRRPGGFGDRSARPRSDSSERSERSFGDRKPSGFGDRPSRPRSDSSERSERSFSDRKPGGFGDRPSRPRSDSAERSERSFSDRKPSGFGDRPARPRSDSAERPARSFGDRKPSAFGDRPARPRSDSSERSERSFSDRKPGGFGGRPARPRSDSAERSERSFGDRKPGGFGDRPSRPRSDSAERPARSFSDRKPSGFGDRPARPRSDSAERPARNAGGERDYGKTTFKKPTTGSFQKRKKVDFITKKSS